MEEFKKKIAFFVKQGMDSFLGDIITGLSDDYETKKIIVTDLNQINEEMQWADICWFEWCDELIAYGSRLPVAREKKILCRIHGYEVYGNLIRQPNWKNVDDLIVVAPHIRRIFEESTQDLDKGELTIHTIFCGVNTDKYPLNIKSKGFNLGYLGYINFKKNLPLTLDIFKKLYDIDKRYKLFLAGQFQDARTAYYLNYFIMENNLQNNIYFDGWKKDDEKIEWLRKIDYMIISSIDEGLCFAAAEGMCSGIKPVLHNCEGIKDHYENKYIFNSVDDAVKMITEDNYDSKEYREFIEGKYPLKKEIDNLKELIVSISNIKKIKEFNYREYWNDRLKNKFDIEGVGYIGLGKIYNNFLYKNRLDMLDYIFKKFLGNNEELSILEFGPGIGVFTQYFYDANVRDYEAIDISEISVNELTKKYKEYKFINGDISKSEYYNKKYDLIFGADVLLHITNEDNFKAVISNISEFLKDDGVCILLDAISILNTKSQSEHAVIRDKNYIENILKDNDLELIQMLPVAFFMNYPFDKKLLGNNEETVSNLFSRISYIFGSSEISDKEKELLGDYLLNKERQILIDKGFGLSEKLVIIKKKTNKSKYDLIDINSIWNKSQLVKEEEWILKENSIFAKSYINDLNSLINKLYQETLTLDYLVNLFNKFSPYKSKDYNNYNFESARVMLGKKEKVNEDYEIIEAVITNDSNNIIVINNIWHNIRNEKLIYPKIIFESENYHSVDKIIQDIVKYDLDYNNNIAGFVFDEKVLEDIKENNLAYMWERAIPASRFMPVIGYLIIAERYIFAGSIINIGDKVLEAPCGFGYGAAYFSGLCSKIEAVDLASENIDFAKNAYNFDNINWLLGDVTKLPYEDNEFDVYISYEVFEHLPVESVDLYLKEAKRVIRDKGTFIISTPNRDTRKNINNPFHIKEYNFKEFDQLVRKYFNTVKYYSVSNFKVEKGMNPSAFDMIAVCIK